MSRKLMNAVKTARKFNDVLMIEYVRKGEECYKNNDSAGRDYWNERYFQLMQANDLIAMDIRKLKEELMDHETDSTTR